MTAEEENDVLRKLSAEQSLKHVQDFSKQIGPREVESHASTLPIREREIQNNYLREAMFLLERRRRGK